MSDESNASKSFEMKVQEQQDKIEAQFRKITRGSWARISVWLASPQSRSSAKPPSSVVSDSLFLAPLALQSWLSWTTSYLG